MSVTGDSLLDEDELSLLDDDDDSVAESDTVPSARSARSRTGSTGRCVTIPMLMKEGFLEPGDSAMAIDYMGQTFHGDLMADGQIRSQETGEVFSSPSAWAICCKKIVNPEKKSGCGWASVRYRGKKLDIYKNMWFKRRREREREMDEHEEEFDSIYDGEKKELLKRKRELIQKIIVKHEMLGTRSPHHDPSTLVECVPFRELNKIQPFTVSVTSTALTVIGFHTHLTDSEVVGYLAGRWDVNSHDLAITHAFPCRCRLGERNKSKRVEYDIFTAIEERKLTLVGWYHSHPHSPPTPTIRDSDLQLDYQIRMKGASDASYTPCVGMIYTPFPKNKKRSLQSNLLCYWVMPQHEMRPNDYPRPMAMEYTVLRDTHIHQDALQEMRLCAEFYRGAPDAINFIRPLADGSTNWERLKSALEPCLPTKLSAQIVEFFHALLFPRPGAEVVDLPILLPADQPLAATSQKRGPPASREVSPAPVEKRPRNEAPAVTVQVIPAQEVVDLSSGGGKEAEDSGAPQDLSCAPGEEEGALQDLSVSQDHDDQPQDFSRRSAQDQDLPQDLRRATPGPVASGDEPEQPQDFSRAVMRSPDAEPQNLTRAPVTTEEPLSFHIASRDQQDLEEAPRDLSRPAPDPLQHSFSPVSRGTDDDERPQDLADPAPVSPENDQPDLPQDLRRPFSQPPPGSGEEQNSGVRGGGTPQDLSLGGEDRDDSDDDGDRMVIDESAITQG